MKTFLLTSLVLLACATPATASYLHLREANVYMTRHFAPTVNGVVTTRPCKRLDAHRASCELTSFFRLNGVVCTYNVTVRKTYTRRSGYVWSSRARHDCEMVA